MSNQLIEYAELPRDNQTNREVEKPKQKENIPRDLIN